MISRYTVDVTFQRMRETEQAIVEQRKYLDGLTDPALKAIAARTLATLEDILLIMRRTHGILIETATDLPCDTRKCGTDLCPGAKSRSSVSACPRA